MNQKIKKASQRLSVLELAEVLGNVSESFRQHGIHRTQFYDFKQRFQTAGIDGLKDILPIQKSHPRATPNHVVDLILSLSLEHPAWGCIRLSETLKAKGITISSPTIQNILIRHDMGNKYERFSKLEEKSLNETIELSTEQIKLLEKANPCFQERFTRSSNPGELLAQDTIYIDNLQGIGKVYLQAIVDTFGNYAFGFIHNAKSPDCAVAILHNDVLPFYREHHLPVSAILTDNGREYCGSQTHHFEIYLMLNDIDHRKTAVHQPQMNGYVKRFRQICLQEFFRKKIKKIRYENIESLQGDFDQWLHFYNTERPHTGYPNMGKKPAETI